MTFRDARGNEVEPGLLADWGWVDTGAPRGTSSSIQDETGDERGLIYFGTAYELMFSRTNPPKPEGFWDRWFGDASDPRNEIVEWAGEGDG